MPINELETAISMGLLDDSFRNYRMQYLSGFDIESLETPIDGLDEISSEMSVQTVVSISVATNIPGFETRHFCRASMDPIDAMILITEFLDYLVLLSNELQKLIPKEITDLIAKLEEQLKNQPFSKSKSKKMKLLRYFKAYRVLNVFGFNSGKNIGYRILSIYI